MCPTLYVPVLPLLSGSLERAREPGDLLLCPWVWKSFNCDGDQVDPSPLPRSGPSPRAGVKEETSDSVTDVRCRTGKETRRTRP